MRVRTAREGERTDVLGVLDAGFLHTDADRVADRIAADEVLVAADGGTVVGALVAEDGFVVAIAVRPNRRGQGVGRSLVAAAADRWGRLVAEFDESVRPFYEALGFDISPAGERYRGVLDPPVR
ncbi:MAG: GNAT family N-acetyltransferase [Halobacteriaceae archaeon]